MTNYRIRICETHDQPQINFCFDCGAPLTLISSWDGAVLTCTKNTYHVKFLPLPHSEATDPTAEGECDLFKIME